MDCRQLQLSHTLDGLKETNIPLVEVNGNTYSVAGFPDDPGIYYFVPWIAKSFGISVDQAINVFLGSMLAIGALIAISSFFFLFKHWAPRLISGVIIFLLAVSFYFHSDVYTAFFFAVATIVPAFVLLGQKYPEFKWPLILSIAASGIIIGYSNYIRNHAGNGVLLFLIAWILLNNALKKGGKTVCCLILAIFTLIPSGHFKYLENNRDRFLTTLNPSHPYRSISHPKWHAIYLGLGYFENNYGIEWKDINALNKVMSINPDSGYYTDEYEYILKNQCLNILKTDPIFILKTVALKIFKLLKKFAFYANLGLLFFFYVRPRARFVVPFLLAAMFYSLPGILVIPIGAYVSGMSSIAAIFGICMIGFGLEKFMERSQSSIQSV